VAFTCIISQAGSIQAPFCFLLQWYFLYMFVSVTNQKITAQCLFHRLFVCLRFPKGVVHVIVVCYIVHNYNYNYNYSSLLSLNYTSFPYILESGIKHHNPNSKKTLVSKKGCHWDELWVNICIATSTKRDSSYFLCHWLPTGMTYSLKKGVNCKVVVNPTTIRSRSLFSLVNLFSS
jgi:hypothetical protein